MSRKIEVPFTVPREVAFDFLVDPTNRMQWLAGPGLRAVEDVGPMPPQVGTRWREHASGGMVSEMRLDAVERPRMWAESGRSRGLSMKLTLSFDETAGGCRVVGDTQFEGAGPWRVAAAVASRVFPYGARRALTRAAQVLADRSPQ